MERRTAYLCVAYIFCSVNSYEIIRFPDHVYVEVGSTCSYYSGGRGYCEKPHKCPLINDLLRRRQIDYLKVRCDPTVQGYTLVCCKLPSQSPSPLTDVSAPVNYNSLYCGRKFSDYGQNLNLLYPGNDTANEYIKQGFTIKPLRLNADHLLEFEYSNSTFTGYHLQHERHFGVGGEPARRILAVYMALLENTNNQFCGGAVINDDWILTAAHCFEFLDTQTTIVTLGEYEVGDDTIQPNEYPIKFTIKEVVRHPEYRSPSSYHDLALIKIHKNIPTRRPDIRAVCLPWGDESTKKHIGNTIILTGWGATIFNGAMEPVLQEVNVTVFDASVCDAAYSGLSDYREKFPNGITEDEVLCAGDDEGGRDACQGDSGGPVVYETGFERFTLAGIVSTGFGCGLKEYPGIYIPINSPKYLSWIKKVAFT